MTAPDSASPVAPRRARLPQGDAGITREPFPASRKIYVPGSLHPDVRVPMREIRLSPRRRASRASRTQPNPPVVVYDTSGPYRPRRRHRRPS
ncbi:MAG: hypothetical protein R3F05_08180 [Planctomycetota bacterium]